MKSKGWRALVRAIIWCLGIWIALFPVAVAAHSYPSLNFWTMASAVNKATLFRDFFFVAVIISVASFANVLYNVAKTKLDLPDWAIVLTIVVCLYYIYVLVYGVTRFEEIAHLTGPVPDDEIGSDLLFMSVVAVVTLAAELGITLTEK